MAFSEKHFVLLLCSGARLHLVLWLMTDLSASVCDLSYYFWSSFFETSMLSYLFQVIKQHRGWKCSSLHYNQQADNYTEAI